MSNFEFFKIFLTISQPLKTKTMGISTNKPHSGKILQISKSNCLSKTYITLSADTKQHIALYRTSCLRAFFIKVYKNEVQAAKYSISYDNTMR